MWRSQLSQVAVAMVSCSKIEALLTSTVSGRPSAAAAAGTSAAVAARSSRSASTAAAAHAGRAQLLGQRLGRVAAGVVVDRHVGAARARAARTIAAPSRCAAAGDQRRLERHAAAGRGTRQSGRRAGLRARRRRT